MSRALQRDRLLSIVPKSEREEFRVQLRLSADGGSRNIDLRTFIIEGAETVATPKGILIRPTLLRPLIQALQRAEIEAIAEGLITPGED